MSTSFTPALKEILLDAGNFNVKEKATMKFGIVPSQNEILRLMARLSHDTQQMPF
jgi:hypothetical protein